MSLYYTRVNQHQTPLSLGQSTVVNVDPFALAPHSTAVMRFFLAARIVIVFALNVALGRSLVAHASFGNGQLALVKLISAHN
jgi:hypothetical protein